MFSKLIITKLSGNDMTYQKYWNVASYANGFYLKVLWESYKMYRETCTLIIEYSSMYIVMISLNITHSLSMA